MGIDCTAIVEYDERLNGKPWWEIVGYHQLGRDTSFFNTLQNKAYYGYPDDISSIAKTLLENNEDFGECWMPYSRFMKLCKKEKYHFKKFYKPKDYDRLRIIFRFDH